MGIELPFLWFVTWSYNQGWYHLGYLFGGLVIVPFKCFLILMMEISHPYSVPLSSYQPFIYFFVRLVDVKRELTLNILANIACWRNSLLYVEEVSSGSSELYN